MSWISDKFSQLQTVFNSFAAPGPYDNTTDNLSTLKVIELKAIAKAKGFKGYTNLRKAELIEMLQQN